MADSTLDQLWLDEQTDRLLGFEVLCQAIKGKPVPLAPEQLADRIGVHKGWSKTIIDSVIQKVHGQ